MKIGAQCRQTRRKSADRQNTQACKKKETEKRDNILTLHTIKTLQRLPL